MELAVAAQAAGQRVPPLFSPAPGTSRTMSINLDDIFADCFFTQDGEVNLLGDDDVKPSAKNGGMARMDERGDQGVAYDDYEEDETFARRARAARGEGASSLGAASSSALRERGSMGMASLGSASAAALASCEDAISMLKSDANRAAKTKRPRTQAREMTEQQKDERRERNREHAKRSRVRKKFLLESLQQSVNALQFENDKLRVAIRDKMGGEVATELLQRCSKSAKKQSLIATNPSDATRILDDPDYSLVKALQTAQQNFVITDPSLPDNPIVFASHGFLTLTGYSLENVLGRNCRFLQGPRTDPRAVAKIRKAIEEGYDTSVCLLNYRIDGSTFYNQFFIAPLRDGEGNVVNYVGVQCQVSDAFAQAIARDEPFPSF